MKSILDESRWQGRFFMLACVTTVPFVRFVLWNDYPLLRPEVAVGVFLAALLALVSALVTRAAWAFRAVLVAAVAVTGAAAVRDAVLAPLLQRFSWWPNVGWALLLLLCILIPAACLLLRRVGPIVAVFSLGSLVVDISQALVRAPRPTPIAHGAPRERPPKHVLYLVFDGHGGPEGLPTDIPECQKAKRAIEDTFERHCFRLYPYAFTNYRLTVSSLPSIINSVVPNGKADLVRATGRFSYTLRGNSLFSDFLARGYAIRVYESTLLSFAAPADRVQTRVRYNITSLGPVAFAGLPLKSRLRGLLGGYLRVDPLLWRLSSALLRSSVVPWKRPGPLAVAGLWPRFLAQEVVGADQDTLFFAHLMTPHSPYMYRSNGGLRDVSEWYDTDGPREALKFEYARYAEQVQALHLELNWFFEFLKKSGVWDSLTIVVHGDHGPRMGLIDIATEPVELPALLDSFSALLAIKFPGVAVPSRVEMPGSVLRFVHEALQRSGSPAGDTEVVHFGKGRQFPLAQMWRDQLARGL